MKVWADIRELFAELWPVLCCPPAGEVAAWLRRRWVESTLKELLALGTPAVPPHLELHAKPRSAWFQRDAGELKGL